MLYDPLMTIDRSTLNLAAPVLCTLGSLVALVAALRGPRNSANLLSSVLGLVGSAAWAMSALDDENAVDVAVVASD